MNQNEVDSLWFSFQYVPGVAFKLNDPVRIESGEFAGEFGRVISLVSRNPVPRYIIELGSGKADVSVAEFEIEQAV